MRATVVYLQRKMIAGRLRSTVWMRASGHTTVRKACFWPISQINRVSVPIRHVMFTSRAYNLARGEQTCARPPPFQHLTVGRQLENWP